MERWIQTCRRELLDSTYADTITSAASSTHLNMERDLHG
jgi:hypothetical protein